MTSVRLPDNQWNTILKFLRACANGYVGKEAHCRRFVEGGLWITRSGAQGRLLPEAYGNGNSLYQRLARGCACGVGAALHPSGVPDPDWEALLRDSTVIRAHPGAAGASKKTVGHQLKRSGVAAAGSRPKCMSVSRPSAIHDACA